MKIKQNPENGQIQIYLKQDEAYDTKQDEVYDTTEHLDALMQFANDQAVIIFDLKRSYKKILERLEQLDTISERVSKLENQTNTENEANL
jgi:DNA repair ATPase RecN